MENLFTTALQIAKSKGYSYFKIIHFFKNEGVTSVEMAMAGKWHSWDGATLEEALNKFIASEGPTKRKPSSFL